MLRMEAEALGPERIEKWLAGTEASSSHEQGKQIITRDKDAMLTVAQIQPRTRCTFQTVSVGNVG